MRAGLLRFAGRTAIGNGDARLFSLRCGHVWRAVSIAVDDLLVGFIRLGSGDGHLPDTGHLGIVADFLPVLVNGNVTRGIRGDVDLAGYGELLLKGANDLLAEDDFAIELDLDPGNRALFLERDLHDRLRGLATRGIFTIGCATAF